MTTYLVNVSPDNIRPGIRAFKPQQFHEGKTSNTGKVKSSVMYHIDI